MRYIPLVGLMILLSASAASAQHGTAETGYYPQGYFGDTWTGLVAASDDSTREIMLTYWNRGKTQTFVGVLVERYTIKSNSGSSQELKITDVPLGSYMTVYYMVKEREAKLSDSTTLKAENAPPAPTAANKREIFQLHFPD